MTTLQLALFADASSMWNQIQESRVIVQELSMNPWIESRDRETLVSRIELRLKDLFSTWRHLRTPVIHQKLPKISQRGSLK